MTVDPAATLAFTCGPPVMLKFVMAELIALGLPAVEHRHHARALHEVRRRASAGTAASATTTSAWTARSTTSTRSTTASGGAVIRLASARTLVGAGGGGRRRPGRPVRRRRRPGAGAPPGVGAGRSTRWTAGTGSRTSPATSRALRPDIVLVADAVDMRAAPGQRGAARGRTSLPGGMRRHASGLAAARRWSTCECATRARGPAAGDPAGARGRRVGLSPEVAATLERLRGRSRAVGRRPGAEPRCAGTATCSAHGTQC